MTATEKKLKREKAMYKMGNQIRVLSRTAKKKDQKIIAQIAELYGQIS